MKAHLKPPGAGDRDLIPANVNIARDEPLHEPKDLIVGAEQAHHLLRVRHDDLRLYPHGRCWGLGPGRCGGLGWATGHMLAARPMPPAFRLRAAPPPGPAPTPDPATLRVVVPLC